MEKGTVITLENLCNKMKIKLWNDEKTEQENLKEGNLKPLEILNGTKKSVSNGRNEVFFEIVNSAGVVDKEILLEIIAVQ
jgi:hypothetical protein